MSGIINLRSKRKEVSRKEAREEANANSAKHGLTKAAKSLHKARANQARAKLDGHKHEP
jgi:hypothetical protein